MKQHLPDMAEFLECLGFKFENREGCFAVECPEKFSHLSDALGPWIDMLSEYIAIRERAVKSCRGARNIVQVDRVTSRDLLEMHVHCIKIHAHREAESSVVSEQCEPLTESQVRRMEDYGNLYVNAFMDGCDETAKWFGVNLNQVRELN